MPSTVLRWRRELIARRWTYPPTGRGRRGLDEQVVALVVRLARENPRWGYLRVVGECRNLGVRVSATSVRRILRRHRIGPAPRRGGPSWTQSCTPRPAACCHGLLHGRDHRADPAVRAVRCRGPTACSAPGGAWVSQQARNLLMDLEEQAHRFRYLMRDRDAKFNAAFDAVFTTSGIDVV